MAIPTPTEISPTIWTSLNRDILPIIATANTTDIHKAAQLSKNLQTSTNISYIESLCRKPVSVREIKNYLQTNQKRFIRFTAYQRPNYINNEVKGFDDKMFIKQHFFLDLDRKSFMSHNYKCVRKEDKVYYMLTPQEELYVQRNNIDIDTLQAIIFGIASSEWKATTDKELPNFQPDLNNSHDIDLCSQFTIYQQRLGCVRRDPRYPQNRVIEIITQLRNTANNSDPYKTVTCYFRLLEELDFFISMYIINDPKYNVRRNLVSQVFDANGNSISNATTNFIDDLRKDINHISDLLIELFSSIKSNQANNG